MYRCTAAALMAFCLCFYAWFWARTNLPPSSLPTLPCTRLSLLLPTLTEHIVLLPYSLPLLSWWQPPSSSAFFVSPLPTPPHHHHFMPADLLIDRLLLVSFACCILPPPFPPPSCPFFTYYLPYAFSCLLSFLLPLSSIKSSSVVAGWDIVGGLNTVPACSAAAPSLPPPFLHGRLVA